MKLAIEIFFSYAHEDEKWRNELAKHLRILKRQKLITDWYDRDISAGTEWAHEIKKHMETAHIILLLISPDFMASDYCWGVELRKAMKRHKAGDARVIPIILRPVDQKKAPFKKLQALPTEGKPVTSWSDTDEAFLNVAQGIRKVVENLKEKLSVDLSMKDSTDPMSQKKVSSPTQIGNVPFRRNPFFTAREDLLNDLHDKLLPSKAPLWPQPQAISGLGGMGKTQTAIEYVYRYGHEYKKVLWVRADTRETIILDFIAIAHLLKLPASRAKDQSQIVNSVKLWLTVNTNWLLILDNADDLQMVYDYLPSAGKGYMLLTTRAGTGGEIAQQVEIAEMEPEDGALFLLRRAKLIAADAPLSVVSEVNRSKAREISEAMDGLPLALDQAAAYIEETNCGLAGYLNRYQKQRANLLRQRGGIASPHPEPVATTWSLSFKKVNSAAAELLRLCAFLHPDAIPEEIITEGSPELGPVLQSVAADPFMLDNAIKELRKFSLIRRDSDEKILNIHRLVQEVLKDEMEKDTQRHWAERTVRAVNRTFPKPDFALWDRCQRCLPHARICAVLIEQWDMAFPEAALLLNHVAYYLDDRALYVEAEPLYRRSLAIREKFFGPEHPHVASSLNNLAALYDVQGKHEQAEPLYQRSLTIKEKTLGPEHPSVAVSLNNLALLYHAQDKYAQAEELYQRALAIDKKALGPEHPDVATDLNNLAELYCAQDKYLQAEPLYQRSLAIRKRTLGMKHPSVATSLRNLAGLYHAQGNYAQAEPLYQQALTIFKKALGQGHPDVALSLIELAKLYHTQGQYDQAEPLYQRALAILQKCYGAEHSEFARVLHNLAELYSIQGKLDQVESLYQRALVIREKFLGPEHPDVADTLNNLAQFYHNQGKYIQAEPLYQQALSIREHALRPERLKVVQSLENYATFLRETKQEVKAVELETRAKAIRTELA